VANATASVASTSLPPVRGGSAAALGDPFISSPIEEG
jgi:hypothetical protein